MKGLGADVKGRGKQEKERRFWGASAKHGSSASLDSAASVGSQKPAPASKDSKL